jgi:hypothetical protein
MVTLLEYTLTGVNHAQYGSQNGQNQASLTPHINSSVIVGEESHCDCIEKRGKQSMFSCWLSKSAIASSFHSSQ